MHRGEHVQPDDLKCKESEQQGQNAEIAEIDRTYLRVADIAEQLDEGAPGPVFVFFDYDARIRERWADLHLRIDVFIKGHGFSP